MESPRASASTGVTSRLICHSTLGAGDNRPHLNFWWKYVMFGLLLRRAYADHEDQEVLVQASALDWTLVRPSAFTDGPHTGTYQKSFGDDARITLKISRADVADFLVSQIGDKTYLRKAVAVSY